MNKEFKYSQGGIIDEEKYNKLFKHINSNVIPLVNPKNKRETILSSENAKELFKNFPDFTKSLDEIIDKFSKLDLTNMAKIPNIYVINNSNNTEYKCVDMQAEQEERRKRGHL